MFSPEHFFGSLFGGGAPQGFPMPGGHPQGGPRFHNPSTSSSSRPRPDGYVPPASKRAIANLPDVVITKRDLALDENKTCIICFEDQQLSGTGAKLPCGHIFCRDCISDWLANKQCTCPVCRYELETNDLEFEKRKKQQPQRKARYKESDLRRMTAKELKQILSTLQIDARGFMEKREFVDAIIACTDKVEMVGEQVEGGGTTPTSASAGADGNSNGQNPEQADALDRYYVEDLETMNVTQLRNTFKLFGLVIPSSGSLGKDELIGLLLNSGKISPSKAPS
ncbi:unnamed protein product [Amoebophrya sp. A120]|nr:unnamed protein product [Amoebophrya sp. A120]|eukprot:GSA120T00012636001.1